jgi:hypothetical protein
MCNQPEGTRNDDVCIDLDMVLAWPAGQLRVHWAKETPVIAGRTINTRLIALAACIGWFMLAWAIDKFWLTVLCDQCVALFAFDFELNSKDILHLKTARVSTIFLFIVPLVLYFFAVVPYRDLRSSRAWLEAFYKWSRPFVWLLAVFVWVWALESAYSLVSAYLPDFFTSYADKYLVKISGTALGVKEIELTGRLGALIGLIVGLYFFVVRGVAESL